MLISFLTALATVGVLGELIDKIADFIATYGYPAVFAVGFLEVIFPPIPSEVVFPIVGFTVQSKQLGLGNAIGMAVVGALGSTVGAITIYFISAKLGRAAIVRFGERVRINESDIQKSEKWFAKYGSIAVFTARMIPGIRELISIPAGISRMHFVKFVAFTFAGSLLWCIALTLVGYYLGETWKTFSDQASSVFAIISIIVVAGIIAAAVLWYAKRRKGR